MWPRWQYQQTSLSPFGNEIKHYFSFNSRGLINKENIPSGFSNLDDCILNTQEVEKLHESTSGYTGERSKPKRQKSSTKLSELNENQDGPVVSEHCCKICTFSHWGMRLTLLAYFFFLIWPVICLSAKEIECNKLPKVWNNSLKRMCISIENSLPRHVSPFIHFFLHQG